jgi:hypothetical protein
MMRDSMQLERIAQLLTYVNGRAGDESDDIIPESELYDYLCRVIDVLVRDEMPSGADSLNDLIRETLANYEERTAGAAKRLEKACGIIIMAYYATLVRQKANRMLDDVFQK